MVCYYTVGKENATLTAQHFAISRKTFHKWFKRLKSSKYNAQSLADQSKAPRHKRNWEVTLTQVSRRCPEQWEGFFMVFIPSTPLRAGLSGGKILRLRLAMTKEEALVMTSPCHCEADEVSRSNLGGGNRDCHALFAMTKEEGLRMARIVLCLIDYLFLVRKLTPKRSTALTAKPMRPRSPLRGMSRPGIFPSKPTTPPPMRAAKAPRGVTLSLSL